MTVGENKTRIIRLEDDVQDIDTRLNDLEVKHIDLMARLDIILNGLKLITALVSGKTLKRTYKTKKAAENASKTSKRRSKRKRSTGSKRAKKSRWY